MASALYDTSENLSEYLSERKIDANKLKSSSTLYIGNLSFFTTESQIYELFSTCGEVYRVIMGLNKNTKTPCGFCFVEFYNKQDAACAVNLLNNTCLDCRIIRVDWDSGFIEGRQFGRGYTGGQKRDELNEKSDPDRPKDVKFSGQKRPHRDNRDNKDYRDNRDNDNRRDNRDKNNYHRDNSRDYGDKKTYSYKKTY